MNILRDNDAVIAAWADEGPQTLPHETRQAIAVGIRAVGRRQSGIGWKFRVNQLLPVGLGAAATLLVVFIIGRQLLPVDPASGEMLLARGNFAFGDAVVELEATARGSAVAGTMRVTHTAPDGVYRYTVDLQCARTTPDGLVIIGGYATEANDFGSVLAPVGSHAAIVLKRGSPVEATTWTGSKHDPSWR